MAAWAAGVAFVYWRAFGHRGGAERLTTPADFGARHESLDIHTADGVRLAGWYLPGTLPAAVVVSGGYRGAAGDVLGISAALQRSGFHVFVYGWRGTPGSEAAAHTLGVHERNDLLAVLDVVGGRLGPVPIGLIGYSMGGSVSISVASGDSRVRAVCSDSAFADPTAILGDRIKRQLRLPSMLLVGPVLALRSRRTGAHFSDFRPINAVAHISPRPVLLIHGEKDDAVPVHHAHRLFEAAGYPKELWLIPATGHVGAYFHDRRAYVDKVTDFFERALIGEGAVPKAKRSARSSD